jgi:predicted Na+-dependent transporter
MFLADPIYWVLKRFLKQLLINPIGFMIHIVLMILLPIVFAKLVKRYIPKASVYLLGD